MSKKLQHVGCFARACRKFAETLKAHVDPPKAGKASKGLVTFKNRIER